MDKQQTFTDIEYAQRKRVSRREAFLETMDKLAPWQRLEEKIRPHYFAGERGRGVCGDREPEGNKGR
jgi:IS5 family transposase